MSERPLLQMEGLHKTYGDITALRDVSISIDRGEIVGLLGPNGAGKTTLVSIVCGLRRADRGRVLVNSIDVAADPDRARRFIGLAPQETGIYPHVTVGENLSLFAELAGVKPAAKASNIESVATALQLLDLLGRKAGELSGGQKRRLHTAIALLNEPALILLDEATTGADVETRAALLEVVRDLAHRGSAVLYSTHYLHEVEQLGADVVILDHGAVIASGSVNGLVNRLGSGVVEVVFSGAPPHQVEGYRMSIDGNRIRVQADDPSQAAAHLLGVIGANGTTVESVEIIRPSLETVYLSLTGRRYETKEGTDVLAS